MKNVRSSATMWRATCNFPIHKSDIYRDYMRTQISALDFLTFKGVAVCHIVEHINIRGNTGSNTTVGFWQQDGFGLHIDSSELVCKFDARNGSLHDEDNFGHYYTCNNAFRCTESEDSTTQYWFGVNV